MVLDGKGNLRPIEEYTVGDLVLNFDGRGFLKQDDIIATHERTAEVSLDLGGLLRVTGAHTLLDVNGNPITAQNVKPCDCHLGRCVCGSTVLFGGYGEEYRAPYSRIVNETIKVYDLTTRVRKSFVVNGIRVLSQ
jgi:hypothetical protein